MLLGLYIKQCTDYGGMHVVYYTARILATRQIVITVCFRHNLKLFAGNIMALYY